MACLSPSHQQPPPPIPLRSILILLNYFRALHDPSLKKYGLLKTSLNDDSVIGGRFTKDKWCLLHAQKHISTHLKELPPSILDTSTPQYPPTEFRFHPEATQARNLSHEELDTLYHQTIAGDKCFDSARLLKCCFSLFGEDQMFSVQLNGEEIHLFPSTLQIRILKLRNFHTHISLTTHTSSSSPSNPPRFWETGIAPIWHCHGYLPYEDHCVVWFPSTTPYKHIIIDLTRIQYGEAGRGTDGELYFLGKLDVYLEQMGAIAGEVVSKEYELVEYRGGKMERLRRSALEAKRIWEGREEMGWCEYCGRPIELGALVRCARCGSRVAGWCCEEHLEYGRRLHARSCHREEK